MEVPLRHPHLRPRVHLLDHQIGEGLQEVLHLLRHNKFLKAKIKIILGSFCSLFDTQPFLKKKNNNIKILKVFVQPMMKMMKLLVTDRVPEIGFLGTRNHSSEK